MTITVELQDFEMAAKECKDGWSTTGCVVAQAVIRVLGNCLSCGYTILSTDNCYYNACPNMTKLIKLFDDLFQNTEAAELYQEAANNNLLTFELKPYS